MTVAVPEPPDDEQGPYAPHDLQAEQHLLAAVFRAAEVDTESAHALVDDLAVVVEPDDVWGPAHRMVWVAMIEATATGEPLDAASVGRRILASGRPSARDVAQGNVPHLASLTVVVASAGHHARTVKDCAIRRRMQEIGTQLVQRATAHSFDTTVDVAAVMTQIEQAAGQHTASTTVRVGQVVEHAMDLMENPERIDVIPSGLHDLDMIYPGMRPGQLIVVGARTSVGKSVLGLTLAEQAAVRLKIPTLLFSLEMLRTDVTQRLIAARAGVDLGRILSGRLDESDWVKVAKHQQTLTEAPLLIDDSSNVNVAHIRAEVRRQVRHHGVRLVIIDYLQLMQMGRAESRQTGIDDVTRQIKVTADELQVPVVLLSQLNRGPEQRTSKRPMLSDLRESGAIENHADVVVLIHRPDMYDRDDRPGECDLIVAKQRNGPIGTATVAFQGHYARMTSMATWAT